MAPKIPPLPEGFTKTDIKKLLEGCIKFYPIELLGDGYRGYYQSKWEGFTSRTFYKEVSGLTGQENIKNIYFVLNEWEKVAPIEVSTTEAPSQTVPQNMQELLDALEKAKSEKEKTDLVNNYEKLIKSKQATPEGEAETKTEVEGEIQKQSTPQPETIPKEPEIQPQGAEAPQEPGFAAVVAKTPTQAPPSLKLGQRLSFARFKIAATLASPTIAKSDPVKAAAVMAVSKGITPTKLSLLKTEALATGISPSQFKNFLEYLSGPQFSTYVSLSDMVYAGRAVNISPYQVGEAFFQPSPDGVSMSLSSGSFVGDLFSGIGQKLFGKAANKVVEGVLSNSASVAGAEAAGAAAGTTAAGAAGAGAATAGATVGAGAAAGATTAGAAAGAPFGGPIGAAIGALVGWISSKVVNKIVDFIREHKGMVAAVLLGGAGLLIGGPVGLGLLMGAGAVGLGTAVGGAGALGRGVGGFVNAGIVGITSVVLPAIGIPILVALISIPVLVAIILFIINSGAYIVPPQFPAGAIDSPYIGVEKEVSPSKVENFSGTTTFTYRIRIFAKKGSLTNVSISNQYKVISRSAPPVPNPQVPEIINPPDIISPTEDYVFEYQISLDSAYNDSIVVDTLSVTADAPEQSGAEARISASIVIGNPPIACPLPGQSVSPVHASYIPGNESGGHGSADYWRRMGGAACRYSLPQGAPNCNRTNDPRARSSGNPCYSPSGCSTYGYSIDVFASPGTDVFLPTIDGQGVDWSYVRSFSNGTTGNSHIYSSGQYTIVLTHMSQGANRGSGLSSGTVVGKLHPQASNTHLHIEFAISGQYVRPEEYFCF